MFQVAHQAALLLLWLASVLFQPFGDPALRANLLSAVLVSGASALVVVAVIQVTRRAAIGIVIGAGMSIGTIFTLFVVPMFYTYIARPAKAGSTCAKPSVDACARCAAEKASLT